MLLYPTSCASRGCARNDARCLVVLRALSIGSLPSLTYLSPALPSVRPPPSPLSRSARENGVPTEGDLARLGGRPGDVRAVQA